MFRNSLLILLLSALFALGISGCDSCSGQEEPVTPQTTPPPEPEPEPEPEDPLKEAKEAAEKDGISVAVSISDSVRIVGADLEAMLNQPDKPIAKKPKATDTGMLEKSDLRRVFNASNTAMRKCYERALKGNPGLSGKVQLQVRIARDGTVSYARAEGSLGNGLVFECMERQAKTLKFPEPKGGTVLVNNPYTFTPDF